MNNKTAIPYLENKTTHTYVSDETFISNSDDENLVFYQGWLHNTGIENQILNSSSVENMYDETQIKFNIDEAIGFQIYK
jgi:hypothetical protein